MTTPRIDQLLAGLEESTLLMPDLLDLKLLLSDLRELKRDAKRYRWLRDRGDSCQWLNIIRVDPDDFDSLDDTIDAAMED